MKKPSILLVVRWPIGGIRTFFRYVYSNFEAEKYRFTLIAPEYPETNALLEDLALLDLKYISTKQNLSNKELFRIVTKTIRSERFDLVHSHGFTAGVCSTLGSFLTRTPHLLTLHETLGDEQFLGLSGFFKKIILTVTLVLISAIHCVSDDARENLLSYFKLLKFFKRKVTVIPNGIGVERFLNAETRDLRKEIGLPENSFLIGFLGRFMPEKGFSYLVDALLQMKAKRDLPKQPIVLTFGEEDAFIREEKDNVSDKGLSHSVFFFPFVANVAPTLKGLDVVVMPSLREACPLLAMEAMVAGVPLIGANCPGLREVLNNTPAKVISVRDSIALADALIQEMKNPTTSRTKGFAIQAAERFDVRKLALDLENQMIRCFKRDSKRSFNKHLPWMS